MQPEAPDKDIIPAFFDCAMYTLDTCLGKEQCDAAVLTKQGMNAGPHHPG